jgi:hypothetical protein
MARPQVLGEAARSCRRRVGWSWVPPWLAHSHCVPIPKFVHRAASSFTNFGIGTLGVPCARIYSRQVLARSVGAAMSALLPHDGCWHETEMQACPR